jgi:hypothetical protein
MTRVGQKRNLPMFSGARAVLDGAAQPAGAKRPSVDAARARLGGRLERGERGARGQAKPRFQAGDLVKVTVRVPQEGEPPQELGVVLAVLGSEVHVLRDSASVRRVAFEDVELHRDGTVPSELQALAGDARVFGALEETQEVRFQDDQGGLAQGQLVEKCRWGALVMNRNGAIVAVGFRRLWPLDAGATA